MAKLNVVFGAVTKPLSRGFAKVKNMMGGLSAGIAGGLAVGLSLVALGIRGIVSAGAKLEQTQVAFEVLLGSAEKAATLIKELRGFANVTPFDTNSVIEASRGLIAAGSRGKVLQEQMRMIGEVAAGTGNKIGRIAEIYSKIKRAGRMTMEEINQLTNSGAITMDEFYKATGKTKNTFRSFVESGKLGFSVMEKIFKASTSEGGRFSGMMDRLSQTLGGKWSIAVGKWQNLSADLGSGTTSPLGRIVDSMIAGIDALAQWKTGFEAVASTAERIALAVETITGSTKAQKTFEEYKKPMSVMDYITDAIGGTAQNRLHKDTSLVDRITSWNPLKDLNFGAVARMEEIGRVKAIERNINLDTPLTLSAVEPILPGRQ